MLKKVVVAGMCGLAVLLVSISAEAKNTSASFENIVFKKEEGDFSINAQYPRFKTAAIPATALDRVNQEVERYAKQQIAVAMKALHDATLTPEDRKDLGGALETALNACEMTFEVLRADDQYVSVKFERYEIFVGAAHGMTHITAFNYDVKRQKILQLDDIFEPQVQYLQNISNFALKDLVKQLGKTSQEGIKEGIAPTKENLGVFAIGFNAIRVYFQPYQVACYAAGTPKVVIPFDNLPGLLLGDEDRALPVADILKKAEALFEKNPDKARLLYARAAKEGSAKGLFTLAYNYNVTPDESIFLYSEVAKKGYAEGLNYALEHLLFRANSLQRADPQRALALYKEAKKANPSLKLYDEDVKLKIIQMCVEPGVFDGVALATKYKIPTENDDEMYYVWRLAEEASIGGRFGKPDQKLILNLVCRGGWAPAELQAAVETVYADWKSGTIRKFNICDHITSGGGGAFCASRINDKKETERALRLKPIAGELDAQGKQLLKTAYDTAVAFIEAKASQEEGHGGSGRIGWILGSEMKQKDAYMQMLEKGLKKFDPAPKSSIEKADKKLNATYMTVISRIKASKDHHPDLPKWRDIRAVQRLWIKYRDANAKLLRNMNPKISEDVWKAWFTELRIEQLLKI